jgi:alkylation response protein AidB-like acyl-CoA dehydrogenase
MNFDLSDDQRLLQETVRRFLAQKCPTERVRAIAESDTGHDRELWNELSELGIASLLVPGEHGGLGSELLDAALVSLELGYACAPGPFLGTSMAAVALAAGDDTEAKRRWLPALASGGSDRHSGDR